MLNVNYRYDLNPKWRIDLGLGAGVVVSTFDISYSTGASNTESSAEFGYQAIVGTSYHINQNVDLGLTYKYLGTLDQNFGALATDGSMIHALMLTLRWNF